MAKFTIEEFMDFELVSRKLIQENVASKDLQETVQQLMLKIFLAGYELGKHGKTEIET